MKFVTYLVAGLPDPDAESFHVETAAFLEGLVKGREHQGRMHICICVENQREDGQGSVYRGIAKHQEAVVDWDGHKVEENDKDGLDD